MEMESFVLPKKQSNIKIIDIPGLIWY